MPMLRNLQGLYGAAALAGAMAVLQVPAAAQRADAIHVAAGTKTDATTPKTLEQIKSVPPRKKSRCHG